MKARNSSWANVYKPVISFNGDSLSYWMFDKAFRGNSYEL